VSHSRNARLDRNAQARKTAALGPHQCESEKPRGGEEITAGAAGAACEGA